MFWDHSSKSKGEYKVDGVKGINEVRQGDTDASYNLRMKGYVLLFSVQAGTSFWKRDRRRPKI